MDVLKRILPYIYFIVAILWLVNAFRHFFSNAEEYDLIFSYKTTNQYGFIAFKVGFAILIIAAGVQRLKMQKE